jgi:hypothetical protein
MSASWALIKFKKTGNIYWGCYEGTSDTMNPFICTSEECYDERLDCYCSIDTCRDMASRRLWIFPKDAEDLDEVQVYSDYGEEYWDAIGSETARMIDNPLDEYGELDFGKMTRGKPDWVDEFEKKLMEVDMVGEGEV